MKDRFKLNLDSREHTILELVGKIVKLQASIAELDTEVTCYDFTADKQERRKVMDYIMEVNKRVVADMENVMDLIIN